MEADWRGEEVTNFCLFVVVRQTSGVAIAWGGGGGGGWWSLGLRVAGSRPCRAALRARARARLKQPPGQASGGARISSFPSSECGRRGGGTRRAKAARKPLSESGRNEEKRTTKRSRLARLATCKLAFRVYCCSDPPDAACPATRCSRSGSRGPQSGPG